MSKDSLPQQTLTREDIEERAAIVADGLNTTQDSAERIVALERGFVSWGELVRAVEAGRVER